MCPVSSPLVPVRRPQMTAGALFRAVACPMPGGVVSRDKRACRRPARIPSPELLVASFAVTGVEQWDSADHTQGQ